MWRSAAGVSGSGAEALGGDVFFVASRLGWALLRPDTLILVSLGFGLLLLWRGRFGAGRAVLGLVLIALLVLSLTPLAPRAMARLEAAYPVPAIEGRPVAGIVVLGGGEEPAISVAHGEPTVNEAGDRFLAALALARRFPEAPVLFTGGSGRIRAAAIPEANVAAALLLRAGLDPSRLILEDASRSTAENARLAAELAPDRPGDWVLVTSAFHMRRAVATFCAAGWRDILPYPVDFRTAPGFRASPGLPENLGLLTLTLHEALGFAVYRASGLAADPLPEGCLAG
ncbi:hypothetical protein CCR90_01245 [Rhodovulum sulfidophilum]|nr:hypothetical protein [Rhodovulum sulfidophilum]